MWEHGLAQQWVPVKWSRVRMLEAPENLAEKLEFDMVEHLHNAELSILSLKITAVVICLTSS